MPTSTPTTPYVLYARKSSESEDRQVQSIEDQVARLKQLAAELRLTIQHVYTEAKSAKKPHQRPAFDEMIGRIERGGNVGILCWQINRLSRNPIDSARVQWLLQQGTLRSIQTIDREYRPEDNVLLFSVESSMANQFVLDLSKNVKRGMRSKVDKGIFPHTAPSGYRNDVVRHTIVPDPKRFSLLRRAWKLMLTGAYTVPQIADRLNNEWGYRSLKRKRTGGKPMSLSVLYRVFTNPFYAGMFEWNGAVHPGKHKPMVTTQEFDRVQILLSERGKPRTRRHIFPFTGLIRCGECGCMVTAEVQNKRLKSGGVRRHVYYHCTKKKRGVKCAQRYIAERALEEQMDTQLKKVTILPQFQEWALAILSRTNDREIEERTQRHETLSRTLLDTQAQLDNLTRLRCRDMLTDGEYVKERDSLQREITKLKVGLRETEDRAQRWLELTEQTFHFATYARYHFLHGDAQTKKEILLALGSNFVLKDRKLALEARPWLQPLVEGYPALEAKYRRLEPGERCLDKTKNEAEASLIAEWQAIVEVVRTRIRHTKAFLHYPHRALVPWNLLGAA